MKRHIDLRILFLGALFLLLYSFTHAQTAVKDTTIAGKTYTIYQGKKGGKYINRVSAKGNEYRQYLSSLNKPYPPRIDLPEEWMEISKDSTRPTKLVGYLKNGTLYILFR